MDPSSISVEIFPAPLLPNLLHFARLLRRLGLGSGGERFRTWLRALSEVDLSRRQQVKAASRAVWVGGRRRSRSSTGPSTPSSGPSPERCRRISDGCWTGFRRTLRASLRAGGELIHRVHRRRVWKLRPVVALLDVSGSMEPYSRLLLEFLYTLALGDGRREVFAFGTRLTRLTRELRQGAVVLVLSDGLDRGDPALLGREMAHLRRSCRRLLWLNPLLGLDGYQPLAGGMQAALPWVDGFLAVHNLESLERLAGELRRPGTREPGENA